MMNDYEKVAKWITEECEDNHQEVACLLKMLYGEGKPELTFEETYQDVLDLMEWKDINDIGVDPLSGKLN